MGHKRWVKLFILLAALVAMQAMPQTQAQSSCPYADIRLDTDLTVDTEAICEAARPWAEDGFRVFILLTDYHAPTEDAWFDFLDRAEADAGLRDLDQPDVFAVDGIAFEASTATDQPWGHNVTFGERLFDTPLDTDVAIGIIKNQMRSAIAAGDPTQAFVQALSGSYQMLHPTPQAAQSDSAQALPTEQPPSSQPQTSRPTSTFPWGWVLLGVIGAGGLGFGAYKLIPWLSRRITLKRHLQALRARTSNLLNACEPLLRGDTPKDMVLYQLFSGYGGEQNASLRKDVQEWLRRSRGALDDAFDLRKKLIDPEVQRSHPLEQQVQDWEMLYVTFVGNSERILDLTDDELRTLLDPMLVLDRAEADVQLTEQLDDIRRELGGEQPLKVELTMVDPAETDAEGILGYLDRVKAAIAYARDARDEAPRRLEEAQERRRAAEENLPDPFEMTGEAFFAALDARLAKASLALDEKQFVEARERSGDILRDIETIERFLAASSQHRDRLEAVNAIKEQGYRPDRLAGDLEEVEEDGETVAQAIAAGDFDKAAAWIKELEADSQRALTAAQEWQALHEQNAAKLSDLSERLDQVEAYLNETAEPAWETLRGYPQGNWGAVAGGLEAASETLKSVRERVERIGQLNSIEKQNLAEAEELLVQASSDLTEADQQFRAIANRLAEVQAAEEEIKEALNQAEADLDKARTFRDEEDTKIGPEVDRQIERAREQLTEAQKLAQDRNFIAAIAAQAAARKLATAAYKSASEQVEEINRLQEEVEEAAQKARSRVRRGRAEFGEVPAAAISANIDNLIAQASDALSRAEKAYTASSGLEDRALAEALRDAIAAYQETNQYANHALHQIRTDRLAYDNRLDAARKAWNDAQREIKRAQSAVRAGDAHGAGRHALKRAESVLPSSPPTHGAAPGALERLRQQAEEAERYAEQAQSQARHEAREVRRERERGSGASRRHPISSPSSRRPSSSSSSRPRSSGTSQRRSSTGRSRRR